MYVINPGFADDPAKFKLAVVLTQIAMPYLPCMAIAAQLSGVLNARGRFALSALHPTLLNLAMLIAVLPQTRTPRARPTPPPGACWWPASRRRRWCGGARAGRAPTSSLRPAAPDAARSRR